MPTFLRGLRGFGTQYSKGSVFFSWRTVTQGGTWRESGKKLPLPASFPSPLLVVAVRWPARTPSLPLLWFSFGVALVLIAGVVDLVLVDHMDQNAVSMSHKLGRPRHPDKGCACWTLLPSYTVWLDLSFHACREFYDVDNSPRKYLAKTQLLVTEL